MKIVIISNALTPHQLPLCDALAERVDEFKFIEAENIDKSALPLGWRELRERDYVISYDYLMGHRAEIEELILDADAVIMGGDRTELVKNRLDKGLLTFEYSERIYKNRRERLKIPYHFFKFGLTYRRYPNLYLLCASAFAYSDYRIIGCFKHKAFKWGYFPCVSNEPIDNNRSRNVFRMLYASRFLDWKHPELAVYLAYMLKQKGYEFELNMYGDGPEYTKIDDLVSSLNLTKEVRLHGSVPNAEILSQMRKHDAFIFTSDSNEGWGAVANEAMGNGCVLVAASNIGSVPSLLADRVNGCIFKENDIDSLTTQVEWLINNPQRRIELAQRGFETIHTLWSAEIAANNLLSLVRDLQDCRPVSISEGPCSPAKVLNNNWFKLHYL